MRRPLPAAAPGVRLQSIFICLDDAGV